MSTIDVMDYLSDDEKLRIATEAFRAECAKRSAQDFERILANAAYFLVRKEVDAVFDGGMEELVKAKAVHIIGTLSAFNVFKKPDAWDRDESRGWRHLQQAMDESAPLIRERVNAIVSDMTYTDLRELIESQVTNAIIEKLMAKEVRDDG